MSEGDKKKEDKTKNEFTKACRCLFENKISNTSQILLNNLINKVCDYNGKYDKFGSCKASIELMNHIRMLLCDLNYMMRSNQIDYNNWNNERSYGEEFFNFIFSKNTITNKMKNDYITKDKSNSYKYDDWIYDNNKKHYYYNELDHYLTHLIGNIIEKKGVSFSKREPGLLEIHNIIISKNL